jgi:hypothetical protein
MSANGKRRERMNLQVMRLWFLLLPQHLNLNYVSEDNIAREICLDVSSLGWVNFCAGLMTRDKLVVGAVFCLNSYMRIS